jgi:translation initiation factor IF-3
MGPRINERIRAREILVIDDAGNKLGIMSPRDAMEIARERGQDLIEVAAQATPPVCRILDYGKFKYEQGKREREAAKKARQSEMKGMTLRPGTDDHDLDFKIKNVIKFLGEGDKVKVTVRFKSREMSHPEFAQAALDKIVTAISDAAVGVVERPPIMEGRQMIMILAPAREGSAAQAQMKKAQSTTSAPRPAAPAAAAPSAGIAAPAAAPSAAPAPVETAPMVSAPVAVAASAPAAAAVPAA